VYAAAGVENDTRLRQVSELAVIVLADHASDQLQSRLASGAKC
jgi:hypothetical protein